MAQLSLYRRNFFGDLGNQSGKSERCQSSHETVSGEPFQGFGLVFPILRTGRMPSRQGLTCHHGPCGQSLASWTTVDACCVYRQEVRLSERGKVSMGSPGRDTKNAGRLRRHSETANSQQTDDHKLTASVKKQPV